MTSREVERTVISQGSGAMIDAGSTSRMSFTAELEP